MPDHASILANRAEVLDLTEGVCPDCEAPAVLAMIARKTIRIDMATILKCLRLAEKEDAIPKLPIEWWVAVSSVHDIWSDVFHEQASSSCTSTRSDRELAR